MLLSTRAPIGYVALAKSPIATNLGFPSLVPGGDVIPEYLYFWLKNNTDDLERHASGTTFRELSGSSLKTTQLPLPPAEEQRAIERVLGTLDDKIELNRRMSETLKEMAREATVVIGPPCYEWNQWMPINLLPRHPSDGFSHSQN